MVLTFDGVFAGEEIAKCGLDAESFENVDRDARSEDTLRATVARDIGLDIEAISGERRERARVLLQSANPALWEKTVGGDGDEPVLLWEGQRAQKDGVDEGEDGGVGSDAEGERENGGDGEAGGFAELPEAEADVAADLFEHWDTSLGAITFFDLGDTAEAAQGCGAGLSWGHAVPAIVCDGELDVCTEFFVEVGVETVATEERGDAAEDGSSCAGVLLVHRGLLFGAQSFHWVDGSCAECR